ncbi:hypothetical protein JOD82_002252 [Paenibacillus sp. 1182]|nr:hypothetical protein [Paenibacillus sp. 1182]
MVLDKKLVHVTILLVLANMSRFIFFDTENMQHFSNSPLLIRFIISCMQEPILFIIVATGTFILLLTKRSTINTDHKDQKRQNSAYLGVIISCMIVYHQAEHICQYIKLLV